MRTPYCSLIFSPNVYPKDKELLHAQLLKEATNYPLKNGLNYFQTYFAQGGGQIHPIIGDLLEFAQDVEENWNALEQGANPIAGLLRRHISHLQVDPISESDSESETNPSCYEKSLIL